MQTTVTSGLDLFDHAREQLAPAAPAVEIGHTDPRLPEAARARLEGQNKRALEMLRRGPCLNTELEAAGVKRVNSRIADVRAFLRRSENKTVMCEPVVTAAGVYRYEIVGVG